MKQEYTFISCTFVVCIYTAVRLVWRLIGCRSDCKQLWTVSRKEKGLTYRELFDVNLYPSRRIGCWVKPRNSLSRWLATFWYASRSPPPYYCWSEAKPCANPYEARCLCTDVSGSSKVICDDKNTGDCNTLLQTKWHDRMYKNLSGKKWPREIEAWNFKITKPRKSDIVW